MKPQYCVSIKYRAPTFINKMKDWCNQQLAEGASDDVENKKWFVYWSGPSVEYGTEYKFWFIEHKDAVLFSLRWE